MGRFVADLTRWTSQARVAPDRILRKVVLDLYSQIVALTPVLTGRARGGWTVNEEHPAPSPERLEKDAGRLIAEAASQLEGAARGRDRRFFITNTVEYIIYLEYGHSRRAPQGMVRKAVTQFINLVNQASR